MASLNPLKDIRNTFCKCPICLEQFKEPKLLPCLHRFCRDCLQSLIQRSPQNLRCCPECRKEFLVSEEGADSLKTDFSMKNLIEFIQLQRSLSEVQGTVCFGCSRKLSVTAYCFECDDFLCKKCHEYHLNSNSLRSHWQHVIALKETKSKSFTFEKLVSLKGASRCQIHSGNVSDLCCVTCHKRPICVACTYGDHKDHDIIDVRTLAKSERKKLEEQLSKLRNCEQTIYRMPPVLDKMKTEMFRNVRNRKEVLQASFEEEVSHVNEKMKLLAAEHKEKCQKITQMRDEVIRTLTRDMTAEMEKIKERYEQFIQDADIDFDVKGKELHKIYNTKLGELENALSISQKDLNDLVTSLENEQTERFQKIDVINEHFETTVKRYENFQSLASSVIASTGDWTVVECVPAICSAVEPLLKEMNTEFPEVTTLREIKIDDIPTVYVGEERKGSLKLNDEHKMTVFRTIKPDEWITHDISTANGIFVVTGYASREKQSSITITRVIDENGFKCETKTSNIWVWRYGQTLSESKIAAVSVPHTIGVYDLTDESHSTKNICELTKSWPNERLVTCVATDKERGHIFVGGYNSTDICVFNSSLRFCHSLTLPESIHWPWDLILNENKVYVCDFAGQRVYAFTIEGVEVKFLCEFKKPNLDEDCITPLNICKDKKGFIYILWKTGTTLRDGKRVLVRYSKVGRQLLIKEDLNCNAACIETLKTEDKEYLLVMTLTSGILYIYHLEEEGEQEQSK